MIPAADRFPMILFALAFWGAAGCESSSSKLPGNPWNTDPDGDTDSDSDTNPTGDTDSDGDSDTAGDGDADSDSESDADSEQGTDTECYEHLDIVFVLDVSTTMGFILQTLEQEIGQVWNEAKTIDDEPHFGLVVFVDDVTVVKSATYNSISEIQSDFKKWYQHTSTEQQTKSLALNTDWPENSLDALHGAATQYAWRDSDTTLRIVIHATDDTFKEAPNLFSSGIQAQHTYGETVQALQTNVIRVASFASLKGGPAGNQDVGQGFLSPYNGKSSIPDATSGEAFELESVGTTISLVEAINDFVVNEICSSYGPI